MAAWPWTGLDVCEAHDWPLSAPAAGFACALLSLLGGHAASAVVSAQLYSRADRKRRALVGVLGPLEG